MKNDHAGFMIFLICSLIAPKIPLGFAALPGKSSISLGIVGLFIWALLSPRHILRIKCAPNYLPPQGLLVFGVYAFSISLASFNLVTIAYATQYFLYLLLGYLLFSGYLTRAAAFEQLSVTYRILTFVGFFFAAGVIVSVWTGPLYPHQVINTARQWGGLYIQQGVGFAEGTNGAGAILIVFSAFFWFVCRWHNKYSWLFVSVAIIALLSTISRSAIGAFAIGLALSLFIAVIRATLRAKISQQTIRSVGFFLLTLIVVGIVGFFYNLENRGYANAIALGFGLGDSGIIQSDTETRLTLWRKGIDIWSDGTVCEQLFGKGFRNSLNFTSGSAAWLTPHNAYLEILGDFGVIGLMLFLLPMLRFVIRTGIRCLRFGGTNIERAAFVTIVSLLVHNMTECFFYSPVLINLVMLVLILPFVHRFTSAQFI